MNLDISVVKDPWPHHQVKNFFTTKEFKKVHDYITKLPVYENGHMLFEFDSKNLYPEPKDITRQSNAGPFNTRIVSIFDQEIYNILENRFVEFLSQIDFKYQQPDNFFEYKLSIQAPGTGWNLIHEDLPPKLYNLMIHISDTGIGTALYKTQSPSSFVKYTDWISNGGQGWNVEHNSGYWHDVTNKTNNNYRHVIRLMVLDKNLKRPVGEY